MTAQQAASSRRRRRAVTQGETPGTATADATAHTETEQEPGPKTRPSRTRAVAPPQGAAAGSEASAQATDDDMFETAPDQAFDAKRLRMPDLQRGFQTVVRDLYADGYNVEAEWKKISQGLELKDPLSPAAILRDANSREALALAAGKLYVVAKVEVNAYLRETEATVGALREQATASLEKLKATGVRTKQITEADVKAEAARLYPDEWEEINRRREQAEGMLTQLGLLSALAQSRCRTITNMLNQNAQARLGG